MRESADVLAFPSLHEEGGWAVAEATGIGLPVVCLDRGGPAILGGRPVAAGWPDVTARRYADGLQRAVGAPPGTTGWPLDLDGRRTVLRHLLETFGLVGPVDATGTPGHDAHP